MARAPKARLTPWLGPGVLIGSLVPLALLVASALRGRLGADPVAIALNQLGLLALIFLLASLAMSPIRILFGVPWPGRIRRMLGLLAFFYASLHVGVYVVVDQQVALRAILEDIAERPFITVGFAAYVLLIPLALTSTQGTIRRLGGPRWRMLHRLAYVAAILAIFHFVWRVKSDLGQPIAYAMVLFALFAVRIRKVLYRRFAAR